jgi:tetratricopeptide (TPR) repeat protein
MLLKLKQQDRAQEVMRKMIALETDDPQSLMQLVDWFIKQKAWHPIEELAARFERTFNSTPLLLYSVAQARRLQDDNAQAEALAKQAYQLSPEKISEHLRIARQLQERILYEWSEREYRHVIGWPQAQGTEEWIKAQTTLADMLHDQQRDLAAAKVLQKLVDAIAHDGVLLQRVQQFDQTMSTAPRMHFFYACHFGTEKDRKQQWKHLDDGLAENPNDIELLIELYRSAAEDPQRHKRAQEMIRDTAEKFRAQINDTSDDGLLCNVYNEYAWMVGNTEGDFDLAIKYSQKSVDIARQLPSDSGGSESGYLDTLAHCHAAKGDYENAVKIQTRAVELQPWTQQIVRALDQFKSQLEKSRSK